MSVIAHPEYRQVVEEVFNFISMINTFSHYLTSTKCSGSFTEKLICGNNCYWLVLVKILLVLLIINFWLSAFVYYCTGVGAQS